MSGRLIALLIGGAVVLLIGVFGPVVHGAGYTVNTEMVMVRGASKNVLTDERGMTLYYRDTDTLTNSTCTGGCAEVWPPLLIASSPTSGKPLPGKLALVNTKNGSQVSYNGHLLYRYSGDTAPQQANGQGVAGQWWVATIDLKPMTSSGFGSPIDNGKGGGGGGGGGKGY